MVGARVTTSLSQIKKYVHSTIVAFFSCQLQLCYKTSLAPSVLPPHAGSFDQSCFTSVATVLRAGDLIHVHTGERGARLDAREGRSFFGIVRMDA